MPSALNDNHSVMVMCEGHVPDRSGCPRASQREWVKVLAPKIKEGRWPTVQGMPSINKADMVTAAAACVTKATQHPLSHVAVSIGVNVKSPDMFRSDYMFDPIVGALRDIGWIHPDDVPDVVIGVLCDAGQPLGTLVQVVDEAEMQQEGDDDITQVIKTMAEKVDVMEKRISPEALGKAIFEAPLPKKEEERIGALALDKGKIISRMGNTFVKQENGDVKVYDTATGTWLDTMVPQHGKGSYVDKEEPADAS